MLRIRHALLTATAVVAVAVSTAVAHADPNTDQEFLAAVAHGSLCCPDQPDAPINVGTPDRQIQVGRSNAEYMTAFPTARAFNDVAKLNQQQLGLDPAGAANLVAIAIRFYAGPTVENQVRAQLGPDSARW